MESIIVESSSKVKNWLYGSGMILKIANYIACSTAQYTCT
jgi:hypothetical protein